MPKQFSRSTKREIAEQQGGWFCFYCLRPLTVLDDDTVATNPPHPSWPQVEHKMPTCKGGTDDLDNLVLACRSCNTHKRRSTSKEFTDKLLSISRYWAWCPPNVRAIIPPDSPYSIERE